MNIEGEMEKSPMHAQDYNIYHSKRDIVALTKTFVT